MKSFRITTGITEYSNFKDFADAICLGEKDLVLTNPSVYARSIEPLNTGCIPLFLKKYGTSEPTDGMVNAILADIEGIPFERIIAVGGGSIIDVAKLLCVAEKGEQVDDLFERKEDLKKNYPLIAVPATCGTGSEVTSVSVINRTNLGTKMGLQADALYPDEAALIAEMLATLPYSVFATSSIDAMVHAAEAFLSPNACRHSEAFSEAALRIILRAWQDTVAGGNPEEAWRAKAADYLLGANYAGLAFGYAGTGAVHATAYPIGGVHHVPHGQSNQLMFAAVMKKYKALAPIGKINRLEDLLAANLHCSREEALPCLYALMDKVLPCKPLREIGMTEEEIDLFAADVIAHQQRLLKNNYIPLSQDELAEIYRSAF